MILKKFFNGLYVSEYVSKGHPDKIADQISDYVLCFILKKFNPKLVKVAIETLIINNIIKIAGEVSEKFSKDDLDNLIGNIKNFVKTDKIIGFYFKEKEPEIELILNLQSPDINFLVDNSYEEKREVIGAGDQGLMFGFASSETPNFMPAPIYFAKLVIDSILDPELVFDYSDLMSLELEKDLCSKILKLGPDAKSQVAVEYRDGKPFRIRKILLSIQHSSDIHFEDIYKLVLPRILKVLPKDLVFLEKDSSGFYTEILVNPAGKFVCGGPLADTGLTGRKIIVDTYGGFVPHGGGAFSGKDPTKVDRSGSYMTRYIAKNLVASGVCEKCLITISYAIGLSEPFSFSVETFGTLNETLVKKGVQDFDISIQVSKIIDLTPKGIIDRFDLWNANFLDFSRNGHFGRSEIPHEKLDLVNEFKKCFFEKDLVYVQ